MSRGLGCVARIIKELFANNPDLAFAVPDLVDHCYPGTAEPEKKHRVSVLRAARSIVATDPDWAAEAGHAQGGAIVFFNQASAQSRALAQLMTYDHTCYRSPKLARRGFWGTRLHQQWDSGYEFLLTDRTKLLATLAPGGSNEKIPLYRAKDVELHIAERDGNVELAARLRAEMDASLAAFLGGVRLQ
jgi:hypothetical protein